jgi:hypothetical protein
MDNTMNKDRKAPEKIYLQWYPQEHEGDDCSWCTDKIDENDTEYIRVDKYKDALEAVDLMEKDRDSFHDENEKLEKKVELAVEAFQKILDSDMQPYDFIYKILTQIKGE